MSNSISQLTTELLRTALEQLREQMESAGVDLELWLPDGLVSDTDGERAKDQILKLVLFCFNEIQKSPVEAPFISVSASESGPFGLMINISDNGNRTESATRAFLDGHHYTNWSLDEDTEEDYRCIKLTYGVQGYRSEGAGRITESDSDQGLAR